MIACTNIYMVFAVCGLCVFAICEVSALVVVVEVCIVYGLQLPNISLVSKTLYMTLSPNNGTWNI